MTVKRRARLPRALLVGAVAAAALAAGPRAAAHPEFSALGANRYVTAAIFSGRVDVTDALLEGALASGEERRRLDADGDGQISDAEVAADEARLAAQGLALTVEVDGRALTAPLTVSIDLGEERRTSTAPLVVEGRASFAGAWPPGARRLRIVVAREPPRLVDTEIGLVVGPGLKLTSGQDLVTFRGPRASSLEERAATFELTGPPPPPPSHRGRAVGVVVGAAALLAVVLALRKGRARA